MLARFAFALMALLLTAGVLPAAASDDLSSQTSAAIANGRLTVAQAFTAASDGSILLVDIRSRREWTDTGVAGVAEQISMHESDFLDKLDAAMAQNPGKPVALICAAGVRSKFMRNLLLTRGYRDVVDVPEGMLGSDEGPGWIPSGLPIVDVQR